MCKWCGKKYGSNYHQLYWFFWFLVRLDFDKSFRSLYHLFNKKAYEEWFDKFHSLDRVRLTLKEVSRYPVDMDIPDEYIDEIASMTTVEYFNFYYGLK